MWFKRKTKNRRLRREYVLDVKLRSSQVHATRIRTGALALSALFLTVLCVYVLWRAGGWAMDQLLYENKAFAIQEVDVRTDGVIVADQLRRWTGVRAGQNLLALDLARVKRNLELVPLVQSVSVERVLPHTLKVRVVEREPIAQVNVARPAANGEMEAGVYHLDVDGWVMPPLDPRQRAMPPSQPAEQLPVIVGIDGSKLQVGRRIDAIQVRAALELIGAFERSPMVDLKRIDVSSLEVLVVTTDKGSEVTFGLTDLEQQLRRWREIHEAGQKIGKVIATLDLAVTNNVPARWLEASAVPQNTPKSPKPLRTRKNNV